MKSERIGKSLGLSSWRGLFFWTVFVGLGLAAESLWAFEVPPLRGAVNDRAGVIPARLEKGLETSLRQFRQKGGAHIALLTVRDLQGETIEQASIQVTDQWKIGDAQKDNGVLILLAQEERRVRIEVGQGLEGVLTDATSRRIIDQFMVPLFRQGQMAQGLILGTQQVAGVTNPEIPLFSGSGERWQRRSQKSSGKSHWITWVIFIFVFIFGGRSPLFAFLLGSQLGGRRIGGSRGFGGGGFGGFSGGGGGFSGGGASGSW